MSEHVSVFIQEEMSARGWSRFDLAFWKPTSITVHFNDTCGAPVGQRECKPQMFCFSEVADWFASDAQFFETRKQVTTQEELIEAIRLLRDTEGTA